VFVSLDHLGTGDSTGHDPAGLGYATLTAASRAAERQVLDLLAAGTLDPSLPALTDPVTLGIGQSMGGSVTVAQQGRYHCYDGIGVLGYSAVHSHPPVPAGAAPTVLPWSPRDTPPGHEPIVLNAARVAEARRSAPPPDIASANNRWLFYYDDVDTSHVVKGPWTTTTYPMGVISCCLTPGVIAAEAAAVEAPVLVALGERDVVADPKGEPRAYQRATSVDLYVCPRMGHMHNFASTRELLWSRIQTWGAWVVAHRAADRRAIAAKARIARGMSGPAGG
jgi:pimeloyl-ACP methyl ester carboxylesterase